MPVCHFHNKATQALRWHRVVMGLPAQCDRDSLTGSQSTGHHTLYMLPRQNYNNQIMMLVLFIQEGQRGLAHTDLALQIARRHLCSGLYAAPPSPLPSFHAGK